MYVYCILGTSPIWSELESPRQNQRDLKTKSGDYNNFFFYFYLMHITTTWTSSVGTSNTFLIYKLKVVISTSSPDVYNLKGSGD